MQMMTWLQLSLLLLSALRGIVAFRYDDQRVDNRPHRYARTANEDKCDEQAEIARWINDQVVRDAKITQFNQRLSELLDVLNANKTEDKHCCFYEKNTMDKLFADLTILSEKYGIPGGASFQKTGDIGQDLDRILDRMRKLVDKEMQSCCNRLTNNLKQLEIDFNMQFEDLKHKFNENNEAKENSETELMEKQAELDRKLSQLKKSIEKLEQKDTEKGSQEEKCCIEFKFELNKLTTQLEAAKTKTKDQATEVQIELLDLQYKQKEQERKINEISEELKKRAENMQTVLENCEKNCGNEQMENQLTIPTNVVNEDSKRLEHLEQLIIYLTENHKKLTDIIETLAQCQQIQDNLIKTDEKLNQLLEKEKLNEQINQNNCETVSSKDQIELQLQLEMAKESCKEIDNLVNANQQMNDKLIQMNESYTDHIFKLDTNIRELQNRIIESVQKIQLESSERFGKISFINPSSASTFNPFDDKIERSNYTYHQDIVNEIEDGTKDKEGRKPYFGAKVIHFINTEDDANNTNNNGDRLDRLEKQQNELSEDIDKTLQLKIRVEYLENQLRNALDRLSLTETEVDKCSTKCKDMDKIDGRIKELESKTQNTKKPSKPATSNRNKGKQSVIGGVDFE